MAEHTYKSTITIDGITLTHSQVRRAMRELGETPRQPIRAGMVIEDPDEPDRRGIVLAPGADGWEGCPEGWVEYLDPHAKPLPRGYYRVKAARAVVLYDPTNGTGAIAEKGYEE